MDKKSSKVSDTKNDSKTEASKTKKKSKTRSRLDKFKRNASSYAKFFAWCIIGIWAFWPFLAFESDVQDIEIPNLTSHFFDPNSTSTCHVCEHQQYLQIQSVITSYTSGFEKGHGAGVSAAIKKMTWSKSNVFLGVLVLGAMAFLFLGRGGMLPVGMNVQEVVPEDIEVTFSDVKGCDEAKKELEEIVEFLMNPDKFSALGGKLPKGVLLSGPPGTGKTLLARAVAGQANVPFFHAAGPEFDEVLVGQGARRVRELFRAAKARAPCVIFIDEIDSVGSTRTSSSLHPYANQTINQLLSEMDGFKANEGVIVIGATNRTSDLDKALLRPGRFDTQVTVGLPDVKGRTEILELYLDKIKASTEIDVDVLAKRTSGFSGADVQNLVNTAAIRAAVEGNRNFSLR